MKRMMIFLAITLVAVLAAASYATNERENLAKELISITSDLSCDNDAQCSSFGYGDRPCGGYQEYRLYSSKTVNKDMLLSKAERFAQLDEAYNEFNGMGSICSIEQPLETECFENVCTKVSNGIF